MGGPINIGQTGELSVSSLLPVEMSPVMNIPRRDCSSGSSLVPAPRRLWA
jgi:hypothetical protein